MIQEQDLLIGSVPKKLIWFAFPLFLANLLQAFYNVVDMLVVCVLYVVSIVYSIYARNEWGFFTWVAMGLCGLTLIFVTMSINNFDLVSGIVWISIILTWLFSMAIVYGINHGQMVPGYIYITVAAPIGVEFFVALIQTLRLAFFPLK